MKRNAGRSTGIGQAGGSNPKEREYSRLHGSVLVEKAIVLAKRNRWTRLLGKGVKSLYCNGLMATAKKVFSKVKKRYRKMAANNYWLMLAELRKQKRSCFPKRVKFSILVPVYNTPEEFLWKMIVSVRRQSYGNWELCLADGSDVEHANVGRICRFMAFWDRRIRYQKLTENKGISANTNACLEMAEGDYIALLDHDDMLHPSALFEVMQAICKKNADLVYTDECVFSHRPENAEHWHYKPDYAPDTLRACNYICHFTVFDRELLELSGTFRSEYDGSQDYDLILRLTEKAKTIVHIPKVLYQWRSHPGSVAESIGAKPYAIDAGKRAIEDHLSRVGLRGRAIEIEELAMYRLKYEIEGEPLISILIPNCDHWNDLKTCIDSVFKKSTYRNFEIIVIENNSTAKETFTYYDELEKSHRNVHVVHWEGEFNYSAINNFGAQYAHGEHLLLLNNDVEVISPEWIEEMLMYSQRSDVGAVGAKLYFPDDTIQHAGVILGMGGIAAHAFHCAARSSIGYMGRMAYAQNLSIVTGACLLLRRSVWDEIGGLDEAFKVAFNDVDLCMRIRKAGYLNVWTPFAELYHAESKSRGYDNTPEKRKRFESEVERFKNRWSTELDAGDPYFNPNLSLDSVNFERKEA